MNTPMVDNAKVMAKGQVTIPIDIRKKLNISEGDRLTFICDNDKVIMMNSALYAMKILQEEMVGEAEKIGLHSDDDVVNMIMKIREGDEDW